MAGEGTGRADQAWVYNLSIRIVSSDLLHIGQTWGEAYPDWAFVQVAKRRGWDFYRHGAARSVKAFVSCERSLADDRFLVGEKVFRCSWFSVGMAPRLLVCRRCINRPSQFKPPKALKSKCEVIPCCVASSVQSLLCVRCGEAPVFDMKRGAGVYFLIIYFLSWIICGQDERLV
jgi:hypothetical protein